MSMDFKNIIKSKLQEVAQPLSQGEREFKDMHKAINHKNLVPGITDQEHVFNGSTKPYDNKYLSGYKPGEDRDAYDKNLKMNNAATDNGYQPAHVEEASYSAKAAHAGKDIGKPGKNFEKIAKSAAKRYGSSEAGKKVAGAILAKLRHTHEQVEVTENQNINEAWSQKNKPTTGAEKGDIHHIEVHPEILKKHAISHQTSHEGEYGLTHYFHHPKHGTVSVYQSDLNKHTGNPIMSVRTHGKMGTTPVAHKFLKNLQGKTMHSYNEQVEVTEDSDYASSMVRTELNAIAHKAAQLVANMNTYSDVEPWVQSKVARAKEEIDGVFDYLTYSEDDPMDVPMTVSMPTPSMANPFITKEEKELSPKQKKIAAVAGNPVVIDAEDFAKLRLMKKHVKHKVLPEASMLGSECTKCGDGHYKEEKGKMMCDSCGHVAGMVKEASVIKSHALDAARNSLHMMKHKKSNVMHTDMKTPKQTIKMEQNDSN